MKKFAILSKTWFSLSFLARLISVHTEKFCSTHFQQVLKKFHLPYYMIFSMRSHSTGYISVKFSKVRYLKGVTRSHRICTWKDFILKGSMWCGKRKRMQVSIRPSRDNCVGKIPQGPVHTQGQCCVFSVNHRDLSEKSEGTLVGLKGWGRGLSVIKFGFTSW